MAEILLARHSKSTANIRDPAFGNEYAPLTHEGVMQAQAMEGEFEVRYGIEPGKYSRPVLASKLLRPQLTAVFAGFTSIDTSALINEGALPPSMLRGRQIVQKHAKERWIPDELKERAERFVNLVRSGRLGYEIYFTHGLFIAAAILASEQSGIPFDPVRGYIPKLATITSIQI